MRTNADGVLLLCDPALGVQVRQHLRRVLPGYRWLSWQRGDRPAAAAIRDIILSRSWSMLLSVYSDYILSPEELATTDLPLNIHPAPPDCRGMGYDVVPLLEHRQRCGASVHWMLPQVDAGRVIMTHCLRLGAAWDYSRLRLANQTATLALLDSLLALWVQAQTTERFAARLRALEHTAEQWSGRSLSAKRLAQRIRNEEGKDPQRIHDLGIPRALYALSQDDLGAELSPDMPAEMLLPNNE